MIMFSKKNIVLLYNCNMHSGLCGKVKFQYFVLL